MSLSLRQVSLVGSPRTNNADENALKGQARQGEIMPLEPPVGIVDTSTSKRRAREET